MIFLHASSNQLGSNSAVALGALTHWCDRIKSAFTGRHSGVFPTKSTVSNPAGFSVSRRNPSPGGFAVVFDQESPLSFDVRDFVIANFDGLKRINHSEGFVSQNQLGSDPKQENDTSNADSNTDFNSERAVSDWINQALVNKEKVKGERQTRPYQVAFRSENLRVSHLAIISGNLFTGKLK